MISAPLAHVGGIPIEETLGSFGPVLLVGLGVAWAQVRAGVRRVRSRAGAHASRRSNGARSLHEPGLLRGSSAAGVGGDELRDLGRG
jgi:hypothetical protein